MPYRVTFIWPLAMQAIMAANGCNASAVRDFLDSRHGRHFADDVGNGLFARLALRAAIAAAVERRQQVAMIGDARALRPDHRLRVGARFGPRGNDSAIFAGGEQVAPWITLADALSILVAYPQVCGDDVRERVR
jgi:hypothetical protein